MVEGSSSKVKYHNPLNDIPDQYLFFGLFAVGGLAIWFMKSAGLHQYVVTAVPVAIMVGYAVIALTTERYRIREDKIGDNIYYLGFLYTLVSLAYALYAFNERAAGAADIITNFGIAIFTTIIGLAGRVFFNQMREDVTEYERQARISLADAANDMKAQLGGISHEMDVFKRNLTQIAEEGVTSMAESAKSSMEANVLKFSEVSNNVMGNIQAAFSNFTDHSSKLNDIASKNVEALNALFERIERIEASPDLLASKLDPVMQRFQEVADETLQRNKAQAKDVKKLQDMIQQSVEAAEALLKSAKAADTGVADQLRELASGIENGIASVNKLAGALQQVGKEISAEIEENQKAVGSLRRTIDAEAEAIATSAKAMRQSAEEASSSIIKMGRDEAERQRHAIDEVAGQTKASLEQFRAASESIRTIVAEQMEGARKSQGELAAILAEGQKTFVEFETALVQVAKGLVSQLNAPPAQSAGSPQ